MDPFDPKNPEFVNNFVNAAKSARATRAEDLIADMQGLTKKELLERIKHVAEITSKTFKMMQTVLDNLRRKQDRDAVRLNKTIEQVKALTAKNNQLVARVEVLEGFSAPPPSGEEVN